jgi:hypothetical protein
LRLIRYMIFIVFDLSIANISANQYPSQVLDQKTSQASHFNVKKIEAATKTSTTQPP